MSENYKPNKPENPESKTRAGEYKTKYIKSNTYLPNVFNTPINRKWLDSTLDQMISKGDLQDIDAFIGSDRSQDNTVGDVYLQEDHHNEDRRAVQFQPAAVSINNDGDVTDVVSFDDVARSYDTFFEEYSYGAAYQSNAHTYTPPINIDKFVNYGSYMWAPDMPIYTSSKTDVEFSKIEGAPVYRWIDDENSFWLQNGQRIRMAGYDGKTYMVTGVGLSIDLIEIADENNIITYFFETHAGTVKTIGIWDRDTIEAGVLPWSASGWDSDFIKLESNDKDYIVIERSDKQQTAWSRNNNWIHRDTIIQMANIIGFESSKYINSDRVARRPIIEFNPNIVKHNMGYGDYIGGISFAVSDLSELQDITSEGALVLVQNDTISELYVNDGGSYVLAPIQPEEGQTATLLLGFDADYLDIHFENGRWIKSQQKTRYNQPPLFRLKSKDGIWLDDYEASEFNGSRIFGYKDGNGPVDYELGFALAYRDTDASAEIIFENFIHTEVFKTTLVSDPTVTISAVPIEGVYYYEENGSNKSSYTQMRKPLGVTQRKQLVVESANEDLVFDVGHSAWRYDGELIISQHAEGRWKVSELFAHGVYVDPKTIAPDLILRANKQYSFKNIVPDTRVVFWQHGTPMLDGYIYSDVEFVSHTGTTGEIYNYGLLNANDELIGDIYGQILFVPEVDNQRVTVRINGKLLPPENYMQFITADTVTIPANKIRVDDIVDLEYYDASIDKPNVTKLPEILSYNSDNELVTEFTLSETINHWLSLVGSQPGFAGDALGKNISYFLPQINAYGGEILLHDENILAHVVTFKEKMLNTSQALYEQGRDWVAFKQRLIGQVRRLWASKSYDDVRSIANDAISAVAYNKRGTEIYNNSNMLYHTTETVTRFSLEPGQTSVNVDFTINGDRTIRDHVYVYLRDDFNADGVMVNRILRPSVDYTIDGKTIILKGEPRRNTVTSEFATLTIEYYDMDTSSYIPQSLTKLFLTPANPPYFEDNKIVGHDGDVYTYNRTGSVRDTLFNPFSPSFDPVAAVLFDIEQRVYAGLVKSDDIYKDNKTLDSMYVDAYSMINTPNKDTWFSNRKHVEDDVMYRYFKQWRDTERNDITPTEPDPNDTEGWTWNYREHNRIGHMKDDLPGYWRGSYHVLFGTDTPHKTPWVMLGLTSEPSWWNEHYSWTDPAKRAELIKALTYGIVSEPGTPLHVNRIYERTYWDWDNQCPVDEVGELRPPKDVLIADPAQRLFNESHARPFEFADWDESQMVWRKSARGQAALITAISQLMPSKAWSEFFQPGFVNKDVVNEFPVSVNYHTGGTNSLDGTILSGTKTNVVSSIVVTKTDGQLDSDQVSVEEEATVLIMHNGTELKRAEATIALNDFNLIESVNMHYRGLGYTSIPSVRVYSAEQNDIFVHTEVELKEVSVVTNGIDQVLYNFGDRNFFNKRAYDVFSNLDTRLLYKLGGFTSKHLIRFFAESSAIGPVAINDSDYELIMYQGAPSKLITASSIKFTKTDTGYIVDGYSPNKQIFYFYEPDVTNPAAFDEITVPNGSVIRKYKKFSKVVSSIEYGAKFARIQDVYNFIRGMHAYLLDNSYVLEVDKNAAAYDFVLWATRAGVDDTYISIIGRVAFQPEHGAVLEIGTLANNANTLVGLDGKSIPNSDVNVTRTSDAIVVIPKDPQTTIGSVTFAVADFEHAALFNRVTSFNRIIFNDVTNQRYHRLKLRGQRTKDWHGERHAPGFLVFDDKIVQNWDSSVDEVRDFYDNNITKFNKGIEDAERITNNNITRDWANKFNLSQNTVNEFYKGMLRDKGTNASVDKIGRSDLVNFGNSTITHDEVWMFRRDVFGDIRNFFATEVEIKKSEFIKNPQPVRFTDEILDEEGILNVISSEKFSNDQPRYINGDKPTFDMLEFVNRDLSLRTAGDLLIGEADHTAFTIEDIPGIFPDVEGIDIPTWNNKISYKRGEIVRREGKVFECNVDSTGLSLVGTNILVAGNIRYPAMPNGSIGFFRANASTDFTEVTFGSTGVVAEDIVLLGSVSNPFIDSRAGLGLTIDTKFINLETKEQVLQPNDYPIYTSSVLFPSIENTLENRYVTVNGVLVDLGEPNAPTIAPETIVSNGGTVFDLGQTLGSINSLFNLKVDSVTVDGILQVENVDYTINEGTSTITFVSAPGDASLNYVDNGYIEPGYVEGGNVDIVVTYKVVNFKDHIAIANRIESVVNAAVGVTDVIAGVDLEGYFFIRGSLPGDNQTLEIGSPNILSANDILGLIPGTYSGGDAFFWEHTQTDLESIIERINLANVPGVFASDVSGRLQITSSNATLSINGTADALDGIGITAGTRTAGTNSVDSPSDLNDMISLMNEAFTANSTGITAANVDGYLVISSSTDYLEMGGAEFCVETGFNTNNTISGGIYDSELTAIFNSQDDIINNAFDIDEWTEIENDPAAVTVWITDDNAFEYQSLGANQVRYNNWNVYKFMDFGFYADDGVNDAICAGNSTSDGNDAEVALNTAHGLVAGDYVMILNSTTQPSVDGIHKVTRVHTSDPTKFYIDMYIEECGMSPKVMVMRSIRFDRLGDTDNTSTTFEGAAGAVRNTTSYNFKEGDFVIVTPTNESNTQTVTEVYNVTNNTLTLRRETTHVPSNTDIMNVSFYNGNKASSAFEIEVYDPLHGIIPGVADREIDFKSPIDFAVYTDSTDDTFSGDTNSFWGEDRVGQIWWNTRTVAYYDYYQGDIKYAARNWGRQFPGSSIDVYEWVKSDVPPDSWAEAVENKQQVFNTIATGEVYSVYDETLNEDIYFYSQVDEWNPSVGQYKPVYYFWVKNKTTITDPAHKLTAKQIASIISNPTSNGISWCAVASDNSLILSNVKPYVTEDNTVMQINRTLDKEQHSSWVAIAEHSDIIPEYWFIGMRDNLTGYEAEFIDAGDAEDWMVDTPYTFGDEVNYNGVNYVCAKEVDNVSLQDTFTIQRLKGFWVLRDDFMLRRRLPDPFLHRFNMYGDDRTIGQAWFKDIYGARREAITIANRYLKTINLLDEASDTWDRRLASVPTVWSWVDYVAPSRNPEQKPSIDLSRMAELDNVDPNRHNVVRVSEYDSVAELDRSEIHAWDGTEWNLVEKKNATIQLDDWLYRVAGLGTWDTNPWDVIVWDADRNKAMYLIVEALRKDIFVGNNKQLFNEWWFGMINYIISEHDYIDWLYKTTYINVTIETPIELEERKYTRNTVNEVTGYINTVKPFHTKIREVFDKHTVTDEFVITLEEYPATEITVQYGDETIAMYTPSFVGDTYDAGTFNDEMTYTVGMTFADDEDETLSAGTFIQPNQWNWDEASQTHRRTVFNMELEETLAVTVTTDDNGNEKIYEYVQDKNKNVTFTKICPTTTQTLTTEPRLNMFVQSLTYDRIINGQVESVTQMVDASNVMINVYDDHETMASNELNEPC